MITPLKGFLSSPLISRSGRVCTICTCKGPRLSVPVLYIPKHLKTSPVVCSEGDSGRAKGSYLESNENMVKGRSEMCSSDSLKEKAQFPTAKFDFAFERQEILSPEYPTEFSSAVHYEDKTENHPLENRIDSSGSTCCSAQYREKLAVSSRCEHSQSGAVNSNNVQQSMMDYGSHLESFGIVSTDSLCDSQVEYHFGDEYREEDQAKSRLASKLAQKGVFEAKNCAIRMLSRRPLTAAELRKKLVENRFPSDCIENAISELQKSGLQSDNQYAEGFASSKWQRLSWGPMRIKKALTQRGIDNKIVEEAVSHVFLDTNHTNEDDTEFEERRWGMARPSVDHLLTQARKQWFRGGDIPEETRKRRLIGWLQRRGFSWKVITEVFKNLENGGTSGLKDSSLPFDFND